MLKRNKFKQNNRLTSKNFYNNTAWRWFRKYQLLKYCNKNHLTKCATCGIIKKVNDKKMHLGHLIKVHEGGGHTNYSVAFDERNTLPQCYSCNTLQGGRELRMLDAVENIHGKGTYEDLKIKSKKFYKLTEIKLKEISDEYRIKYNELKKIKGDPWKKKTK